VAAEVEVGTARIYETAIGSGASESVAALLPLLLLCTIIIKIMGCYKKNNKNNGF